MIKSSNPALSGNPFALAGAAPSNTMTLQGTINKTATLLALCIGFAFFSYDQTINALMQEMAPSPIYLLGGSIGAFILALITIFKKSFAPITAPLYAILEGLALGGISAIFEQSYQGLVTQAILLTFGVLLMMLFLYRTETIRVTETFKKIVIAGTGAICLIYLLSFILGFFNINLPFIHDSGPFGILFSLVVVVMASLNLVMDFDFIHQAALSRRAPKYMEWYGSFSLMLTLVWLYLEMLRLLSKMQNRK